MDVVLQTDSLNNLDFYSILAQHEVLDSLVKVWASARVGYV